MSTPAPAPAQRLTREDLIRMGQAGQPWAFLPVAFQAIRQIPQDAGLRYLIAKSLTSLGLRTLAIEQLSRIPDAARGLPEVAAVRAEVESLPDDAVPMEHRIARVRAAAATLAGRAADLSDDLDRWIEREPAMQMFVAADGNVIRRPADDPDALAWVGLGDHRRQAVEFCCQHLAAAARQAIGPLTLEGACPPWLFLELCRSTPTLPDGYTPRIRILQADASELLDGLSMADLAPLLAEPRVEVYIGPTGLMAYESVTRDRFTTEVIGPVIPLLATRTRIEPAIDTVADALRREQERALTDTHARVQERFADRDSAYWASRYAEAHADGRPLRVLIPTCRYSTYIRHASADLAAALQELGHTAEVLVEPDDHSRFSRLAYWDAIERLDPDLVVLINYPRASRPGCFPDNLPFVCWIQDAMGHLFDAEIGAAQSDLDFLAGCLLEDLFTRFGYARALALASPVVASEAKFHDAPVSPDLAERLRCDVAVITHQSETPARMHERLRAEAGGLACDLMDWLRPRVEEVVRVAGIHPVRALLDALTREAFTAVVGAGSNERDLAQIHNGYTLPMAERLYRHQTIEWAAEIAERRGWTMRIFGDGWDRHPALAHLAAGRLAHDEELRAAYAGAAAQLHASIYGLTHQRITECALSGGLTLCRWSRRQGDGSEQTLYRVLSRLEPARTDAHYAYFTVADDPELMALTAMKQRLGAVTREEFRVPLDRYEHVRRVSANPDAVEPGPLDLMGDLSELVFTHAAELEQRLERAIEDRDWRTGASAMVRRRAAAQFTSRAFGARVIGMVTDRLTTGAAEGYAATDTRLAAGTARS